LTSLTSGKVKSEWHSSHQQAFDKIKKVIGTELHVLLCYSDCNKPVIFHLYTDASDHQLGAVIMQDKKPIAFYSRKLNTSQKRYTTTERELLSAIETCKEYKNILLGYPIIVFTDHKNNTFNGSKANTSDRVLRTCWLLLLGEYGVTFEHLPGKKHVIMVEDFLSRLDIDSLKFQKNKEEVLTLLSGSENNSIINIKLKIPIHTALIFKEQAKVKETRSREKGLGQPHYSIQHIKGYDIL
jgi:hypothetical protein